MLVVVAPGQGAQTSGFLSAWLESESNKEYLQWLSAVSGIALLDYGTQADAETIKATQLAQPLLVAGGLCAARSLFGDSDLENTIDLTAGHSVGELT
ncbi:MAG: ACP S-malonyltransferase, partial [Propionibacteriaceae bacterium]|nr:ACP S-malonyltransferase [Propionibacteriaceae bacterium]